MRLVILESPYKGDLAFHRRYLRAAMLDCFRRGEAAFASHGLYTMALDDNNVTQRNLGIEAGFAWRSKADATVMYVDLGISDGMKLGIKHAMSLNHPIETRELGGEWADYLDRLRALKAKEA